MNKSTKNIFILFSIILLSIFLGYNLFLNYEIKGLTKEFTSSFNDKNESQMYYKSSGYNFFEKVYIKDIDYYDHDNDISHRVELIKFENIDLDNKIPRFLKGYFENTNFNTNFRNSADNTIFFDYEYDSNNQSMNFNIDNEIENIGSMNISFSVNKVILSSFTDNFLSNNIKVRKINNEKIFKQIKRIDDITITLNNDQFLTYFTALLTFSDHDSELEFFEYKFNNQNLIEFKKKLMTKISDVKQKDPEYYKNYLETLEDALLNNKGVVITFNPKTLSGYSYDSFWDTFTLNRKQLLKIIEIKIN